MGNPDAGIEPTETFELVGHEVRIAILRTLGAAREGRGPPEMLSFSELRERADVEVGSSKFNYHLQQLLGSFIEQRDGKYSLRHAGTTLYRQLRARGDGNHPAVGPFELEFDCYHCGTPVEATYEDWKYTVRCPGCEFVYDMTLVPPGVTTADDDGRRDRLDEYVRHKRLAFAREVCPICANRLTTTLLVPVETFFPRPDLRSVCVHRACQHCTNMRYLTVGEVLRHHPSVVDFCRERGRAVRTARLWDLGFAATDTTTAVRTTGPWTLELRVTAAGERLVLVVDEDLSVRHERVVET